MLTEDGKAHNGLLDIVPQQTADPAGELVFNVLWSYVEETGKTKVCEVVVLK